MKMLFLAKTSVFIMTGLIVAGLALVLFKITDNLQKDKPQNTQSEPIVTQQEKITHMSACASFVCLLSETPAGQARLLVVNPNTGRLHHQVLLKKE